MAKDARTSMCSMNFCYCRDPSIRLDSAVKPPPTTTSCAAVPKKFDAVATRLLSSVTAAFFASLERCSCINIATKDDVDDGGSLPLILDDVMYPATDVRCTADRRKVEDHHVVEDDNKDDHHIQMK